MIGMLVPIPVCAELSSDVQIPNTYLGGDEVSLWARISLHRHAPQKRVSRMGNPMLRPGRSTSGTRPTRLSGVRSDARGRVDVRFDGPRSLTV
jgi:hypothetical protein